VASGERRLQSPRDGCGGTLATELSNDPPKVEPTKHGAIGGSKPLGVEARFERALIERDQLREEETMTPEEIALAVQAFLELEPELQKGIVALVHLIHKPNPAAAPAPTGSSAPNLPQKES
jgi:hypothetical protein